MVKDVGKIARLVGQWRNDSGAESYNTKIKGDVAFAFGVKDLSMGT